MLLFDATTAKLVDAAAKAAASGSAIQACCNAVANSIGAGYRVRVKAGNTTYLDIQYSGTIPIVNKQLVIPNDGETLISLQNMPADQPGAFCLITNAAEDRFIRGTVGVSGTDFILTTNLQVSSGIAVGSLQMFFDPALDQSQVVSGAVILAFVGDSFKKGAGPVGNIAESEYMSDRSAIYNGLRAAGLTVTVRGVAAYSNPMRGGGPEATAAQGGIRISQGGGLTISSMLDLLKAENPASDYSNWIINIAAGRNDAWQGVAGAQIATEWQALATKAESLFPGATFVYQGIQPTLGESESVTGPTATYLNGRDGGKIIHVNLRAGVTWTAADFTSNFHWTEAGSNKAGAYTVQRILSRIQPSNNRLEELIQQSKSHEVLPFVANPSQLYTQRPFVITDQTIGVGNFSLLGRDLMPSWFNPGNKSQLLNTWFTDIHAWWVACNQRNSSGSNANASNAAVRVFYLEFLIWRGGNNWDQVIRSGSTWVGSYNYNFVDFQSGAEWRFLSDGSVVCRPSYNGLQVAHGGGGGVQNIANPSQVRGVIMEVEHQLVDYATGEPISDSSARRALYCGADGLPPGGSANTSFQGLNYAPGLGSGSFVEVRNIRRRSRFTTMTEAQLRANRPPGY